MKIENNILRHYLKNCYFINGTAYAGKSTMCKMLAETYDMIHCEENYNMDTILSVVTAEAQPNLSYFNEDRGWLEFVSRPPAEYAAWRRGTSQEVTEFEIAELIRISSEKKVIVDTNISCEVLHQISDYDHVAIMVAPPEMSVRRFFDRSDPEKQTMLSAIEESPNPEWTLENFRQCIGAVDNQERYDHFVESGFFVLKREDNDEDTRQEMFEKLAKHFGLTK